MTSRPWTAADIAALRARYPHEPTASLAAALGRSVTAVYAAVATTQHGEVERMPGDGNGITGVTRHQAPAPLNRIWR